MSENRETPAPGDPVEEEVSTETEVLAAARRATEGEGDALVVEEEVSEEIAVEIPDADGIDAEELARREAVSLEDTELNMEPVTSERVEIVEVDEMPSAAAEPRAAETTPIPPAPPRDGEIQIDSADQFADLYTQTPPAPELKGNRAAGTLIALLATLGFAVVYAGVLALWLASDFPPSTFLESGLLPWVTSWFFIAAVVAFFVGLEALVLIAGRAGWWAYVLGGFFVAVLVWAVSAFVAALTGGPWSTPEELAPDFAFSLAGFGSLTTTVGLTLPVLGAAIVAREAAIWFGAWIGSRGRKVKQRNAEALAEYDQQLAAAGPSAR